MPSAKQYHGYQLEKLIDGENKFFWEFEVRKFNMVSTPTTVVRVLIGKVSCRNNFETVLRSMTLDPFTSMRRLWVEEALTALQYNQTSMNRLSIFGRSRRLNLDWSKIRKEAHRFAKFTECRDARSLAGVGSRRVPTWHLLANKEIES